MHSARRRMELRDAGRDSADRGSPARPSVHPLSRSTGAPTRREARPRLGADDACAGHSPARGPASRPEQRGAGPRFVHAGPGSDDARASAPERMDGKPNGGSQALEGAQTRALAAGLIRCNRWLRSAGQLTNSANEACVRPVLRRRRATRFMAACQTDTDRHDDQIPRIVPGVAHHVVGPIAPHSAPSIVQLTSTGRVQRNTSPPARPVPLAGLDNADYRVDPAGHAFRSRRGGSRHRHGWSQFIFAFMFLGKAKLLTISVGVARLAETAGEAMVSQHLLAAGSVLAMLQRFIVSIMITGAVKG